MVISGRFIVHACDVGDGFLAQHGLTSAPVDAVGVHVEHEVLSTWLLRRCDDSVTGLLKLGQRSWQEECGSLHVCTSTDPRTKTHAWSEYLRTYLYTNDYVGLNKQAVCTSMYVLVRTQIHVCWTKVCM